jgi:hypothetical protein
MIQKRKCPNIGKTNDIVGWVPIPQSRLRNGLKRTVDDFVSQPGLVNG